MARKRPYPATILPTRETSSGTAIPAADMRIGEIAVNSADGTLFVKREDGVVAPVGVVPTQVVSTGGLAALTSGQQDTVVTGTIVTTTDGKRWVYTGSGSKTASASYIELADISPAWASIPDKPTTFAPATHSHVVGDVTGLETALTGKQATLAAGAEGDVLTYTSGAWVAAAPSGGGGGGDYLPLAGGTMTGNIAFDGTSGQAIGKGWIDTQRGGNYGISLYCSIGYQFNWQAGWLICTEQDYTTPRPLYLDGEAGTTLRVWGATENDGLEISNTGITFADGTTQTTAAAGLPAGATEGDVLTYSSGSWVAAAPSGGGGGASLPSTSTEGTIAVYDADASAWTTGGDSMNLTEVVLASYGAGSGNKLVATFGPVGGAAPGLRAVDSGAETYMELNSAGLVFPDGSEQLTAAIPLPTQTGVTGDVLTLQSNGLWEPAAPSGGGGGGYTAPLYARSTTDESQTSVSASTGLTLLPIAGSATYYIEGLAVIEAQADTAIGLKLSAGTSDGEVLLDHDYLHDAQNNEWSVNRNTDQTNSTAAYNNGMSWMSTATAPIRLRGWVTTGAISSTNIALHFGSTSSMATITLKAGSWIMATRVA